MSRHLLAEPITGVVTVQTCPVCQRRLTAQVKVVEVFMGDLAVNGRVEMHAYAERFTLEAHDCLSDDEAGEDDE